MRALRLFLLCSLLFGCSAFPASGPTEREVVNAEKGGNNPLGFRIVDVSPQVVSVLARSGRPTLAVLGVGGPATRVDEIGPGDTLNIAVYEVGNGIFNGAGATTPPLGGETPAGSTNASGTRLPPVQVDSGGYINLPYAGRIRAAGRTPASLANDIRIALHNVSQDPQVVVSMGETISSAVFVLGDVKNPGRRPLTLNGEHLLDIVALSGGTTYPSQDTLVDLTRRGRTIEVPLRQVESDPAENVALHPGDRVRLVHQQRTFTVFGASGKVSEIPFEAADVSLAEGLARAGGPQNDRADPNAVFLFRFEPAPVARDLGLPPVPNTQPDGLQPVIYRLDMINPASYFLSQRFAMENKDLIYVANARTDRFGKFVSLIYGLAFPVLTGATLVK